MKKVPSVFVSLCLCWGLVGCSKSISKITTNDLQMNVGESKEIEIKLEPEGMNVKDVTCKIANDPVAKLEGVKVTGLKEGSTAYTCTSDEIESISKIIVTSAMTDEQKKSKEEADKVAKAEVDAKKVAADKASKEQDVQKKDRTGDPIKVSKFIQFEKNDYKNYSGNYRKDKTVNGGTMHKLFSFSDDNSANFFDVSDDSGNSTVYYYNSGWGGQHNCKFDYETNSPKEGANCSDQEIENAKSVKSIFDSELKALGLTIEDLNKQDISNGYLLINK